MQREKSTPGSDSTYSPVEADCNEITQQDEAEWDQVSQHRPPTQQRRPKIPKHLSRVAIGLAIILLCSFAIPFAVLTARSIRWSASGSGIDCNSPPFGSKAGSIRIPDSWKVVAVDRLIDGSGVRILFEDHAFSEHRKTRTIFQLSVIQLPPTESGINVFGSDGKLDRVTLGYTGTGFPSAMNTAPQESDSYSTSYRTIDGMDFTRISWSAADTILKEGQLVHATTHYFSYWGRRSDFLILMAGGYTTGDVCLLHPSDAIAGTLQHGIDEAFVPAVGIKASNYSKSADIPRHQPRTADDLFDP